MTSALRPDVIDIGLSFCWVFNSIGGRAGMSSSAVTYGPPRMATGALGGMCGEKSPKPSRDTETGRSGQAWTYRVPAVNRHKNKLNSGSAGLRGRLGGRGPARPQRGRLKIRRGRNSPFSTSASASSDPCASTDTQPFMTGASRPRIRTAWPRARRPASLAFTRSAGRAASPASTGSSGGSATGAARGTTEASTARAWDVGSPAPAGP